MFASFDTTCLEANIHYPVDWVLLRHHGNANKPPSVTSVIGWPSSRFPDTTPVFDKANTYCAPAETDIDRFVSSMRKIWDDRIDWKMQLSATNVYQRHDLIPIQAQP